MQYVIRFLCGVYYRSGVPEGDLPNIAAHATKFHTPDTAAAEMLKRRIGVDRYTVEPYSEEEENE
jgi:hypothetical protein